MTNEELLSVAEIVERATNRLHKQAADHEAKYKAERDDLYQREGIEQKRRMDVEDERNALRAEVAELKTQLERLTSWAAKNQAARETLQSEIERLKSQTPKQHPVKVGEYVKNDNGDVCQVREVYAEYLLTTGWSWAFEHCTPCEPPNHDTEAGKAAAEAAVKPEPVADEIKVGDLGEVFQATTRTLNSDIGITGRVSSVYLDPCHGGFLVKFDPSTQSRRSAGMQAFGLCDVRKVTT